jgi:hypothetical protein
MVAADDNLKYVTLLKRRGYKGSCAFFRGACNTVLLCILKARHLEVIWQLELSPRVPFERREVNDQRILDSKHSIILNVLARAIEDLGHNGFVTRRFELDGISNDHSHIGTALTYQEMYMRWSHRMPVERLEYLASWSIIWDGVRYRSQAVKVIFSIFSSSKCAPQIHFWLLGVLLLVQSVRCSVPNVHNCTFNRFARPKICDYAMHPRPVSLLVDLIRDYTCTHF